MIESNNMNERRKNMEIDIVGVIQKVLKEKKLLLGFVVVFAVLGVIVALDTTKEYTANVVLAPEISGSGGMLDNLSGLASMVGIDLSKGNADVDAIYPEIYPDVVSSSDFIVRLFNVNVKTEDDSLGKTYYEHLTKDVHISFWLYPKFLLSKLFAKHIPKGVNVNKVNVFNLTKGQYAICNEIRNNVSCSVDKKTSVITISVKDNDRLVSAIIADTIQSRLQQYIIMYRTKKARTDLAYSQKLFTEAKSNYIKAQQTYGSYADANTDVILESFRSKRDEMENDMQLRYNMYTQLAQQLQLAKAKVQDRTPVFTIIQSATIPLSASSTPRSYIVILYMFIGVIIDALWVIVVRDRIKKR